MTTFCGASLLFHMEGKMIDKLISSPIACGRAWWLLSYAYDAYTDCTQSYRTYYLTTIFVREVLLEKILSVICHCLPRGATNVSKIFRFCLG